MSIIQLRRGTTTEWATINPILKQGEPGIDLTTGELKIGNGTDAWSALTGIAAGEGGGGGETGPAGPAGPAGAAGPTGPTGATGAAGSKWYSGAGAPANGSYLVGDWYLNVSNNDVYEKTGAAVWTLRANLQGDAGPTGAAGADGALNAIPKGDIETIDVITQVAYDALDPKVATTLYIIQG